VCIWRNTDVHKAVCWLLWHHDEEVGCPWFVAPHVFWLLCLLCLGCLRAGLLHSAFMEAVDLQRRGGGKRIPGVKYGEKALRVTPQLLWRAGVEVACTGAHQLTLHTQG